jgi:hypothetical protein
MPRPKKAPTWKKALRTFYLVQPVLQFLLLAIAITLLTRCSPLSPSGDKSDLHSKDGSSISATERINSMLSADWIERSMKVLGDVDVSTATEPEIAAQVAGTSGLRASVSRFVVGEPSASAQIAGTPSIQVKLTPEEFAKFLKDGKIRKNLADALAALKREDSSDALVHLRDHPELVNATAMLVLNDQNAAPNFRLKLTAAIAVLDEQHAVLQLTHRYSPTDEDLKAAAAIDAKQLAIVID